MQDTILKKMIKLNRFKQYEKLCFRDTGKWNKSPFWIILDTLVGEIAKSVSFTDACHIIGQTTSFTSIYSFLVYLRC